MVACNTRLRLIASAHMYIMVNVVEGICVGIKLATMKSRYSPAINVLRTFSRRHIAPLFEYLCSSLTTTSENI